MQAPGGVEEDLSGDFKFGGWTAGHGDQVFMNFLKKQMGPSDYLLGRKTFQIWEPYWPNHGDFWPSINEGTKYILSTTIERSDWDRTVFIKDLAGIKQLKESDGPDIQVWGSSELARLLLENELVDELWLKIYPVILGSGKRLFGDGAMPATFKLVESTITTKGVVMANYVRDGAVKTGNIEV